MPFAFADIPDLGAAPTASDVVLKFIRGAIISGSLDEGEPIRQDDVARMFNISKIPVREALKRLEAEGFVAFQRNKGAIVASMSEPEIVQIFEVRAMLESNAIRLSLPHMNEKTFDKAQASCDSFAKETDVGRWAELNWEFHSSLYLDAGRPYLLRMIRSVNDRIERYLRVQLTISGGHELADREHREILAACRAGETEQAAKLVYDHIMNACQSLQKHLAIGKVRAG
ncbi:GntR family transcriptional regulator [Mesorhizobium sp. M1A.F.Ca.IN.022.07.1.1]|uniref:GntR family transcriptional regulator n=2 Tax=Mesorhizobium TaxID=68287 RepID=UPI000BAE6E89|nr:MULTISPECIES: GntR family transcriptional regulator [unclassified Mesorhizobium]PBB32439.1 GntR family transcriptional regulator [Mesorhizobium sp. WSM3882]RUV82957.1 GntR family transcriptional regulator [Mesorhizobium sp. M1A.F.Ca.IN.020.32.1.1]RUV90952.1 GntR family transcriptional regulator [Mesorhizobium sp. M1A.F.Ca.IN.022.07.1.1]RUW08488.1 GntR family transcriptional regulator [Mesorhizobium sp. M1A.F.Ca.IN.022.05.2.1]RUW20291.1 GntR family transcriptional regulator [Mesorhizobium sp